MTFYFAEQSPFGYAVIRSTNGIETPMAMFLTNGYLAQDIASRLNLDPR